MDRPTRERIRHAGKLYDPGTRSKRASRKKSERRQTVHDQTAIDALWKRNQLERREYEAAERLAADIEIASIAPAVTASWQTPVDGSGWALEPSERAAAASVRIERIRTRLYGRRWSALDMAIRQQYALDRIGKVLSGYRDRSQAIAAATGVLQTACDDLAGEYGIG